MKSTLLFLILIFAGFTWSQQYSIQSGGLTRLYTVYLPPSYTPGTPTPLVIAMHGLGGSDTQFQTQSKLDFESDDEGFIVVYPRGTGTGLNKSWNAGTCCSQAVTNNIDDVGFIDNLIDTLATDYSIDLNRVYATGHSNGSMMSYRLACEMPDRIAAIATSAGAWMVDAPCTNGRDVPVIHFHSYLDLINPVHGGISSLGNVYIPPADSILNVMANNGNCTIFYDTVYSDFDYDLVRWSDCDCHRTYDLYLIKDGGHSWPGGNQVFGGDPPSVYVNADSLLWEFFLQHTLDCSAASIDEVTDETISVYPNPVEDALNLSQTVDEVYIYDELGRVVGHFENVDELSTAKFEPGYYLLKILKGESVTQKNIIKH